MRRSGIAALLGTVILAGFVATAAPAASVGAAAPSWTASWTLAPIPAPGGGPLTANSQAPHLSCPTTSYCSVLTWPRYLTTLANGNARTVVAPTWSAGRDERLNAVACAAARDCVAVGQSEDTRNNDYAGYREELHGTTWLPEDGPLADNDVVCNVDQCVAMGYKDAGVPVTYIADRDEGGSWVARQIATPWRPAGPGFYVEVDAMSCPPSGACVAVGYGIDDHASDQPLFLYRSGDIWKAVVQALPAGADPLRSDGARSISCAADRNCVGLGTYVDAASHDKRAFAEVFADGVLSATPVPMPPASVGKDVDAGGVSCAAIDECAGLAGWRGASRGQLLRYHDGAWSYQLEPAPLEAVPSDYNGVYEVSCASSAVCVGVGSYTVSRRGAGVRLPAVWTWTGGRWTVRVLPAPTGLPPDASGALKAVTCPGPRRCFAVGTYGGEVIYGVANLSP